MHTIAILGSLVLWIVTLAKPQLGHFAYLLWCLAFALMIYGWSLFYAVVSLIATASFEFLELDSESYFLSTVLPWFCGICTFIVFISLVAKFPGFFGGHPCADSTGCGTFDSGCDSGGGGGDSC